MSKRKHRWQFFIGCLGFASISWLPLERPYPYSVWLGEKGSDQIRITGGKGSSLSVLQTIPGIRVPEGFIITTTAYETWLAANPAIKDHLLHLDALSNEWISLSEDPEKEEQAKSLETTISDECESIKKAIEESVVPLPLVEDLTRNYQTLSKSFNVENLSVAIRSSSTAEDLPNASFAGQHDTFLNQQNIEAVIQSTKRCWASLFHPHTVQYRNQLMKSLQDKDVKILRSLSHANVQLAVVVQRVISPQAAGVGFTITPTGEKNIYIEANYGLGETVVQGNVIPDAWKVDSNAHDILQAVLGEKKIQAVAKANGGIEVVTVSDPNVQNFCLDRPMVLQVAQSIHEIGQFYRDHFGYPYIDTEFAIDKNGTLYFVQARPETVFSNQESDFKIQGIQNQELASEHLIFKRGACGYPGAYSGRLTYAETSHEALSKIQEGDILLTHETTPEWSLIFSRLGGVIVDVGGLLSHTAIVGRENKIPTLLSTSTAVEKLKELDGKIITLDATNHSVYSGSLPLVRGSLEDFQEAQEGDLTWIESYKLPHDLVDEGGKWLWKPNEPLCGLQLGFISVGFDQISAFLHTPIQHKIIDNKSYVLIEDTKNQRVGYAKFTDIFLNWDLTELEKLLDQRIEAEEALCAFASDFENPDAAQLEEFCQVYQNWVTQYLMRGRFGHGSLAILMQKYAKTIPDPLILDAYLHLRYPQVNTTMEKRVKSNELKTELSRIGYTSAMSKEELSEKYPALWVQINEFAASYEHVTTCDLRMDVPIDEVLTQLTASMHDQEFSTQRPPLSQDTIDQMDTLFKNNTELARVMILGHRHLYQKENEHNRLAKANHCLRRGFMQLGEELVASGELTSAHDIFECEIDELIEHLKQMRLDAESSAPTEKFSQRICAQIFLSSEARSALAT